MAKLNKTVRESSKVATCILGASRKSSKISGSQAVEIVTKNMEVTQQVAKASLLVIRAEQKTKKRSLPEDTENSPRKKLHNNTNDITSAIGSQDAFNLYDIVYPIICDEKRSGRVEEIFAILRNNFDFDYISINRRFLGLGKGGTVSGGHRSVAQRY